MSISFETPQKMLQIHDSIMGNSPPLLISVLDTIDPNTIAPVIYFDWYPFERVNSVEDEEEYNDRLSKIDHTFAATDEGTTTSISLLHIAIYNCCKCNAIYQNKELSLQILDILISYHLKYANNINWSKEYNLGFNTIVFNTPGYLYNSSAFYNQSPLHFAVKLKSLQDSDTLGMCINKLIKYEKDLKERLQPKPQPSGPTISMKQVPEPVFNSWQSLLFSEKYADVVFEITDDSLTPPTTTKLYGHRNVLASSSDYFDAMLSGKWKESHSSNDQAIIKINQNLEVYKCLLTYIYTGKIESEIVSSHSLELLDLAAQCQYDVLTSLCEIEAVKLIKVKNVVSLLLSSNQYELKLLKTACMEFIRRNTSLLIFDSKLLDLAISHKKLFNEIKKELGQAFNDDNDDNDNDNDNDNVNKENINSSGKNDSSNIKVNTSKSNEKKRTNADSGIKDSETIKKKVLRSSASLSSSSSSIK